MYALDKAVPVTIGVSYAPSDYEPNQMVDCEPEVARELRLLDNHIDMLLKQADTLETKLSPALAPQAPQGIDASNTTGCVTPLAESIRAIRLRASAALGRLSDIQARVQL